MINDFANLYGRYAGVERLRQTDLEFFLAAATEQRGKNDEVTVSFTQNGLDRLGDFFLIKVLEETCVFGIGLCKIGNSRCGGCGRIECGHENCSCGESGGPTQKIAT